MRCSASALKGETYDSSTHTRKTFIHEMDDGDDDHHYSILTIIIALYKTKRYEEVNSPNNK